MRVIVNAYSDRENPCWYFSMQVRCLTSEKANNIKNFAEDNCSMHTVTKTMSIDFFADLRSAFRAMCNMYDLNIDHVTVSAEVLED